MKKSLIIILLFISLSVFSQEKVFRVGFTTGVSYNTEAEDANFHAGAVFNISFTEKIGLQSELLYEYRLYSESSYINVPIMFEYKFVEGLSLQAGPKVGFNLGGGDGTTYDTWWNGDYYEYTYYYDYEEDFNISIMTGVQYVTPFKMFANFRPEYNFSNESFVIGLSLGMLL